MNTHETAFALLSVAWLGLTVVTYRCVISTFNSSQDQSDLEHSIRVAVTRALMKGCTLIGLLDGVYSQRAAFDIGVILPVHHRVLGLVLALGVASIWILGGAVVGWISGSVGVGIRKETHYRRSSGGYGHFH